MTEIQKSVMFTGLTIIIITVSMITLGNNVFATEYSKYTNNKYGIQFDDVSNWVFTEIRPNTNIIYPNLIKPLFDQRDNNMIIPIGADFKDSNNAKVGVCAQSYHKMIPKIYQDSESYWEGSVVACAYGMYNYNVNIGDKKADPLMQSRIELEATQCMFDDHCMKKIKDILKGKIALEYEFPGSKWSPEVLKYEEERIEAQKSKLSPEEYKRQKERLEAEKSKWSPEELKYEEEKIKAQKGTDESKKKISPQEEEQQLVTLCAQYLYDKRESPLCQDLTPELKEKVQLETQKIGNSSQNSPPTVNQDEEIHTSIDYCVPFFYAIEQPQGCENLPVDVKQQVKTLAEKRQERMGYMITEKDDDEKALALDKEQ